MSRFHVHLSLAASLALCACGESPKTEPEPKQEMATEGGPMEGFVTVDRLPTPDDPHLIEGRTVWAGTCQACHGLGEAGSPKVTDKKAWAPRIAQGIEILHQHALKGFIGPSGTMMPERGGNLELTDQQIIAAVDFMVANSR
jgi:cytochrome c5